MHLHPVDLAIVALYLIGITLFGLRFAKKGKQADRSLKSYFLADNTIPWWAIALSIVSAETSTLTIISIPGVAFAGDFGFLQIVIGYMLGRIVVALLFLPRYFRGEMLTAYQLIDQRFGKFLHKITAGLFLLTRAAAEGVRVFAVSIVVSIAIGTGSIASIGIISALTLLYTFEGGMAAVIWTDVVQMAIYLAGTLVAVWSLGQHVGASGSAIAGWHTIHTVAAAAGKFHIFDFALNLTTTYTFWAGVLGGTFLTMASHGTDQLMVQRMLAARNLRESRLALLSSGVVIFIQFALFLLIGAGLYVFYGPHSTSLFHSGDYIFPTFIVRELPLGIAGLLVAAILAAAMSNLSAALNSLSSTTVVDFYMSLRPQADTRERNLISRSSTVLWAIVLFAIAIYSLSVGGKGHVVEIGLSIASVAYGCLLGVFLLGTLTKFATEIGTAIGMLCGFIINLALWQFPGKVLLSGWTYTPAANQSWSHPPPIIQIPHIAWTWYVLIGALATFLIGALMSLIFRKQSPRKALTTTLLLTFLFLGLSFRSAAEESASPAPPQQPATAPDFSPITQLITNAIADHALPGAVVIVGHNGHQLFERAYGDRKLPNEPGLDGTPSPAEPVTEDTIFDMASLSKNLATSVAIMQLYEQHKIHSFDDPIDKYLPAFNPTHDPERNKVTLRMLLTHTSGEAPDISLKDPWGLATPDRAEGFRLALASPLARAPGTKFVYSDINFILLGYLVEQLSGQREDVYARQHIFLPLGMIDTEYHPFDRVCGPHKVIGAAIMWAPSIPHTHMLFKCPADTWSISTLERTAPTTHDNEGDAQTNPHYEMLTRGTVHDPTTRRMGGVAGHAGVFSTAHDVSLYASALLEKLLHNTGPFPLKQSTLRLMTQPEQPNPTNPDAHLDAEMWAQRGAHELQAANTAEAAAIAAGDKPAAPGLAPLYPAIKGQDLRGYGWDIDTAFSKPRGLIFPIGSFGHTGYTGTTLWMDPYSDTYVVLLSNAVHPYDHHHPISNLRGEVSTAAARALDLSLDGGSRGLQAPELTPAKQGALAPEAHTLTGIDVLEATHFAGLSSLCPISKLLSQQRPCRLGLLTNQTGRDAHGARTVDILYKAPGVHLTTLFSPEHGINGALDQSSIDSTTDAATHLPVISLYASKPADRHPTHAELKDLDAVVIDLQDAGVRYWTYEAASLYFLEASAAEKLYYHHNLRIFVLDRPNPIGGLAMQGPISDPGHHSYVDALSIPSRHGLTLGELLRYADDEMPHEAIWCPPNSTIATRGSSEGLETNCQERDVEVHGIHAPLTVIPMLHWQRSDYFADTGLPWIAPSPNLRTPEAAILYPALGLIETTNISVGRGTSHPFSFFGAGTPSFDKKANAQPSAWFNAADVAADLTARHIPGVTFTAATEPIAEDSHHYPFHGQTIPAVRLAVTDRAAFDSPECAIEILSALHHLYPTQFHLDRAITLMGNKATLEAIARGDDPRSIAASWQPTLAAYRSAVQPFLLYPSTHP